MTESQELFEPSQVNEDELIDQLLNEEDEPAEPIEELPLEGPPGKVTRSTNFPLSRIKALMKMDPDVGLTSSESIFLVAKAAELFLKILSKETFKIMAKTKRKTIQKSDVFLAIKDIDALCFLEGAME